MSSAAGNLDRASQLIKARLEQALRLSGMLVEGRAKDKCPVDEGYLRANLDHYVVDEKDKIRCRVGTNVEYAPFVHQGTGIYAVDGKGRKTPWAWKGESSKWAGLHFTWGQKPKPFLKDAMERSQSDIKALIKESQKGIKL